MTPLSPARAPMTSILIGLIAGLLLARHFDSLTGALLAFALISSLVVLLLARRETLKWLWVFVFIFAATLCFWAYGSIRLIPEPSASDLKMPQREARLTLKVQTVMRPNERCKSANVIARVLQAPKTGRLRNGDLIYAQLKIPQEILPPEDTSVTLQKGLQVHADGLLKPIPGPEKTTQKNDFNHYLENIGVYYQFKHTSELTIVKPPSFFALPR